MFYLFGARKRLHYNPTKAVKVAQPDPNAPDVFTRREINLIVATPTQRRNELNMAEYWLWSGPRFAELMAMS